MLGVLEENFSVVGQVYQLWY